MNYSKLDNTSPSALIPETQMQNVNIPKDQPVYNQSTNIYGENVSNEQRFPPIQQPVINMPTSCAPNNSYLIQQAPTKVYTQDYFNRPEARWFLQNVQPNIFSYSNDVTPLNANIGISYTPQIPPRVSDQVNTPIGQYPLYSRIDPQLIRDDGPPQLLRDTPVKRENWSSKVSSYDPMPGSIDYNDIYDPRYTSYGDPYRSYVDVNLGNVGYYYSEIDAYRRPNYVIRSKVDFIDVETPMNKIIPYYQREASLDDVKGTVENRWMADSLYQREDISERLMRPANARNYQLRAFPMSRASNSSTAMFGK